MAKHTVKGFGSLQDVYAKREACSSNIAVCRSSHASSARTKQCLTPASRALSASKLHEGIKEHFGILSYSRVPGL